MDGYENGWRTLLIGLLLVLLALGAGALVLWAGVELSGGW